MGILPASEVIVLRREVLRAMGSAVLVLPLVPLLPGCDGGSVDDTGDDTSDDTADTEDTEDSDSPRTCEVGDAEGEANFHGHTISVPQADLEDLTGDRTYTSTVATSHSHTVVLTAADRQALVDDCEVTVTSTNGGHTHTWLVELP